MSAHNYDGRCGCSACCEYEDACERDEALRHEFHFELTCCPDFISEVPLNPEECIAAAKAVNDGDLLELGRLFLAAIEREASECIAVKAEECGITPGEAAERLVRIYRTEPARRAA